VASAIRVSIIRVSRFRRKTLAGGKEGSGEERAGEGRGGGNDTAEKFVSGGGLSDLGQRESLKWSATGVT